MLSADFELQMSQVLEILTPSTFLQAGDRMQANWHGCWRTRHPTYPGLTDNDGFPRAS
jgi:hypothetical protein